ncbi:MAG: hypothetical protein AAF944_10950 [Bacteroidota bacterium]
MFDANGTEGLELFTWIVGGLLGIAAALTFTHFLAVQKEDSENDEEISEVKPARKKVENQ